MVNKKKYTKKDKNLCNKTCFKNEYYKYIDERFIISVDREKNGWNIEKL